MNTDLVDERPWHPRRGIHQPTSSTPARRPGSVRRTATTTMTRPDGLEGALHLQGTARDLATRDDGTAVVLGNAGYMGTVDFLGNRQVTALVTDPARNVAALVGVPASSGFRTVLELTLPDERDARSLLYLLLDDIPVATLVSGFAIGWAGTKPSRTPEQALRNLDICSGWRTGGTIHLGIIEGQASPAVTGPRAPSLRSSDKMDWHPLPTLPPHGMRRHRRLDLVLEGEVLHLDALFRDSQVSPRGSETIVHEYTIRGTIDPASLVVLDLDARPQVLPWVECPLAAESAPRLVGREVTGLRREVRQDLTGVTTCTHLNDTLRSLEDITALAAALGVPSTG